ncbi:hypothetical protein [Flavobacterium chilense]|uniref:Uncharacterized protein n=1 Tax=Flavobacterium chilense TaxID=946677 RepID=A0A1M7ESP1_9FLAO|nr:hypothetical protein [Flavobacterium chilense]SHL94774.1 hypothetical protein SAMN05444484_10359 [Flavobacterium chilense]
MTKLIQHSKENIHVKLETSNYTAVSNDLKGHLQGIDDALENNTGNGEINEQNNFVRNLYINLFDLYAFGLEDDMLAAINAYIATLPSAKKTILDTESKVNIVLYEGRYS